MLKIGAHTLLGTENYTGPLKPQGIDGYIFAEYFPILLDIQDLYV